MLKSQSAMEYLMTYGWAILIIAVVLSVLFQLGVFSSGNFQPHAQPGSCQVSRTVAGISLEGQCNGMLPQYVAQFNGAGSYIQPAQGVLGGTSALTVSLWFNTKTIASGGSQYGWIDEEGIWGFKYGQPASTTFCFATVAGGWTWCGAPLSPSSYTFNTNTWYFIAFTYSNGNPIEFYLNDVQYPGQTETGVMTSGSASPLQIGPAVSDTTTTLNGAISNVQIYNTSLSQSEIQALYLEGIGGAPIRPQNIVGWWPLNGNANDYSGNNNNGQLNGVTFSSSWESGYTTP